MVECNTRVGSGWRRVWHVAEAEVIDEGISELKVNETEDMAEMELVNERIPVSERDVTNASMTHQPATQTEDDANTERNEGLLDIVKNPDTTHAHRTPAITSIPTPYGSSTGPNTIAGSSTATASTTVKPQGVAVNDISKRANAMKLFVRRPVIIIVDKDHPISPMWILAVVITSLLLLGQIVSCAVICCFDYERSRKKRHAASGSADDVEPGLVLKDDSFSFEVQDKETQPLLHKS
ncbi:hypothetical protein DL770_005540 [Monosporascus sp. CRB-9-2]|nr:hypothetical protein DL770_005540 [Monosporascus sp. CRB-9-2]